MPLNATYILLIPKFIPTTPASPSAFQTHICSCLLNTLMSKTSNPACPHPNSWFPPTQHSPFTTFPISVNGNLMYPISQAKTFKVFPGFLSSSQNPWPSCLHSTSRICYFSPPPLLPTQPPSPGLLQ